jgi:ABC-type phosphate transport system ATPase subunit
MIQTPESEKEMSTPAQPSSLASVANAKAPRTQASTAQGTGLETRGIHAWFGKNHVLSDINLDFTAGSVTALIGPSGCGKSTFIRTINRMHEFIPGAAMAGEVRLDGKDIYAPGVDVTKIRLQIGMVFQKPNPFPSMPCSALDPGSTLRIEETIRELSDSMTIVIVTHNMQQAARVSDYTAFFLSDGGPGEMIEVARTSEIFSQPKDQRTENYVTGRFG